jgi:Transposase, Mutator family
MLTTFVNTLMPAGADAICGAPYGMAGPGRVNVRNGYRHRDFGTRAGTLDVAIPKLRSGSTRRSFQNRFAESIFGTRPLSVGAPLRPETKGQARAYPDRTRAIPCNVRTDMGGSAHTGCEEDGTDQDS